jgi:D-sedoheptulose 7-phosphate isomerase
MTPDDRVRGHLIASADLTRRTAETCGDAIRAVVDVIVAAFRRGGKVLLCGNGGSAADCQHMAAEFMSRLHAHVERPPLAAIALTTDTSFLTAHANDAGFDGIFARQVAALGRPGDVLVAITTSGKSANVLRAVETARAVGMRAVALTGGRGLGVVADVVVAVPGDDTQHIQEAHIAVEHVVCALVEHALFPPGAEVGR